MYFFSVKKPISFFTNHFAFVGNPSINEKVFKNFIKSIASTDAEFDVDFEFQVET